MSARIGIAVTMLWVGLLGGGCATSFEGSTVAGAVKASNAFGLDLYGQARKGRDNFVCSPAGAAIALTMAAAGARGETQTEMLHALHIDPTDLDQTYSSFAAILASVKAHNGQEGLSLTMADRVWAQKEFAFRPDYLALLRTRFRAPLVEADFMGNPSAAVSAINQWASDETHGRIPKILEGLEAETRMVLTNAVYLKARWLQRFSESATRDDWFTTGQGKITTKMMKQSDRFRYAEVWGAKLIELPYQGGLSMIVILPNSDDGLTGIENRLAGSYDNWIGALEPWEVDLKLPRFTTETTLRLVGLLQALGIRQAFDGCAADFSGMFDATQVGKNYTDPCHGIPPKLHLYIGRALQKAWIETNEVGTEAAAVTVVEMPMMVTAGHEKVPLRRAVFHADHPFLYLIRDGHTGVILFAGRVVEPATASSQSRPLPRSPAEVEPAMPEDTGQELDSSSDSAR